MNKVQYTKDTQSDSKKVRKKNRFGKEVSRMKKISFFKMIIIIYSCCSIFWTNLRCIYYDPFTTIFMSICELENKAIVDSKKPNLKKKHMV